MRYDEIIPCKVLYTYTCTYITKTLKLIATEHTYIQHTAWTSPLSSLYTVTCVLSCDGVFASSCLRDI